MKKEPPPEKTQITSSLNYHEDVIDSDYEEPTRPIMHLESPYFEWAVKRKD